MPSACSRWPPVGSGCERSKTPMLSSPRKPPGEEVPSLRVLAVHPPREVEQQLLERAREEQRGRAARGRRSSCRRASRPTRAPAGSRRRTRTRTRGSARSGACTTRAAAAAAAPSRSAGSIARERDMWKARSHAAYHGILPLVRHRDDVAVVEVRPIGVAPVRRSAGGGGLAGSPSSQCFTA